MIRDSGTDAAKTLVLYLISPSVLFVYDDEIVNIFKKTCLGFLFVIIYVAAHKNVNLLLINL